MASLDASIPPWIPEDDLLLKNAVEAGASLEALAKGAVRFSRKFTLVELRDRWRSLLYDPLISAQASLRMADCEISSRFVNNGCSNTKPGAFRGTEAVKRKVESVRQLYYAMKKKCRHTNHHSVGDLRNFGFDGEQKSVQSEEMLINNKRNDNDDLGNCSVSTMQECDFVDISDSLLNFSNEEQPIVVDAGSKDVVDKSFYEDVNMLLAITPKESNDNVNVVEEHKALASVSEASLQVPETGCSAVFEVISEQPPSGYVTSTPSRNFDSTNGEIVCVLNTEDTDIPCNDDVLMVEEFDASVPGITKKKVYHLSSSSAKQGDNKQELSLITKEDNLAKFSAVSPLLGKDLLSVTSLGGPHVRRGSEFRLPDSRPLAIVSREATNAHGALCQDASAQATSISAAVEPLKAETLLMYSSDEFFNAGEAVSVSEAGPSTISLEEPESDDDLPNFSDIEAMILNMDLCPEDDSDSYISREVARYQNEANLRTFMRLEQCACARTQRAIASRGALAILYGRHLKHYIRQTEVVLGRATEAMDVDIDLGREGPANKISRRQALIKLEADGSFSLKNLGKSPMFLNGKEVATGQITSLCSNSLIEVRDMAFAFETNSKSVRQYMANVGKNKREGNGKFAWSDEMVP